MLANHFLNIFIWLLLNKFCFDFWFFCTIIHPLFFHPEMRSNKFAIKFLVRFFSNLNYRTMQGHMENCHDLFFAVHRFVSLMRLLLWNANSCLVGGKNENLHLRAKQNHTILLWLYWSFNLCGRCDVLFSNASNSRFQKTHATYIHGKRSWET